MRMREIAVGDVPVRALRVTFVGELGWELYCPTEYGAGLWRALWEAGARARPRRRRLPRDRLDAAGEGLPRVGRRHHARRDARTRAGSASACKLDKRRLHRRATRWRRRGERGPRGGCAASCSRTRARSRSATSRCASTARSSGASRAAATATRSSARSPTPTCRPSVERRAPRVEVDIFGALGRRRGRARAAVRPARRAGAQRRRSMAPFLFAAAAMFTAMYSTQAILPQIARAFAVSPSQAGLTVSVVIGALAVGRVAVGAAVGPDRAARVARALQRAARGAVAAGGGGADVRAAARGTGAAGPVHAGAADRRRALRDRGVQRADRRAGDGLLRLVAGGRRAGRARRRRAADQRGRMALGAGRRGAAAARRHARDAPLAASGAGAARSAPRSRWTRSAGCWATARW